MVRRPSRPTYLTSDRLRDGFYLTWTLIGLGIIAAVLWRILRVPLAPLVPSLIVAALTTYLYAGPVRWLVNRGVKRPVAVLGLFAASAGLVAVAAWLTVPLLAGQTGKFLTSSPTILADLQQWANGLLAQLDLTFRVDLDITNPDVVADLTSKLLGSDLQLSSVLSGAGELASHVLHLALGFVLGPLIAIYVLVDLPRIAAAARRMLPASRRDDIVTIARNAGRKVGMYLRGQLIVSTFVGVATTAGMAAVGLPFWAVVGVTAGVTNLVPLVGPLVGGALGVTVALTAGTGLGQAVTVAVIMIVVQQVESNVIGPQIMARAVDLRPLTVLATITVAGTAGGISAMVIAIPLVATTKSVLNQTRQLRRNGPHPPPQRSDAEGGDGGEHPPTRDGATS